MKKLALAAIPLAITLSGCGSFNVAGTDQFSCPGMPKGVVCKSPRQVYDLTDAEKTKGKGGYGSPTYVFATEPSSGELSPVPVLEQAKVMRVWIAPWIDNNNDQHWPGLVFTVVQAKQWHFGNSDFDGIEAPVPHKFLEGAPQVNYPAPPSNTGSADMPKNEELFN